VNAEDFNSSQYLALKKLSYLLVLLLLTRSLELIIGFDRLPILPALGDEVILNDPALTLARTGRFVCGSFANSPVHLDQYFGHHPPVFFLAQAFLFRLFGFSAFTLRILGIASSVLAPVFILLALIELCKREILDRNALYLAAPVVVLDATTITYARWARMESFAYLLFSVSMWLLLKISTSDGKARPLSNVIGVGAGVCFGLTLGTHFAALLLFPAFILLLLMVTRRSLRLMFPPLLVSGAVPALIWLAVHRGNSIRALHQMAEIMRGIPGPLLVEHSGALSILDIRGFNQDGGTTLFLFLLSTLVLTYRTIFLLRRRELQISDLGVQPWFAVSLTLNALIVLILLLFVIPSNGARVMLLYPVVALQLALAFSGPWFWIKRLRRVVLPTCIVLELLSATFYLGRLPKVWNEQDPNRFSGILDAVSSGQTAAVPPELWFAFQAAHRQIAVFYPEWMFGLQGWTNRPGSLDTYDVVILKDDMGQEALLVDMAARQHTLTREIHVGEENYFVYDRSRLH
jgi:hypothetical protein